MITYSMHVLNTKQRRATKSPLIGGEFKIYTEFLFIAEKKKNSVPICASIEVWFQPVGPSNLEDFNMMRVTTSKLLQLGSLSKWEN